jgi:hypothetical protein
VRDRAEHQVGGLGIEREIADLVDDGQQDGAEAAKVGLAGAMMPCLAGSATHAVAVRGYDALGGEAHADRQGDREVRLAGAGG